MVELPGIPNVVGFALRKECSGDGNVVVGGVPAQWFGMNFMERGTFDIFWSSQGVELGDWNPVDRTRGVIQRRNDLCRSCLRPSEMQGLSFVSTPARSSRNLPDYQ